MKRMIVASTEYVIEDMSNGNFLSSDQNKTWTNDAKKAQRFNTKKEAIEFGRKYFGDMSLYGYDGAWKETSINFQ